MKRRNACGKIGITFISTNYKSTGFGNGKIGLSSLHLPPKI
jgi:hypothetical protein